MTATSTRRAILAAAVAVPASALPALATEPAASDEYITIEREHYRELIQYIDKLHAEKFGSLRADD